MPLPKNSSEKKIKESCLRWIKKNYPRIWIYKISDLFKSGIPDFILVCQGECIFIELKKPGGKVSKIQEVVFNEIRATDTHVYIAHNLGEFKSFVRKFLFLN